MQRKRRVLALAASLRSEDSESDVESDSAERPLKRSRFDEARQQQLDAAFLAPDDSSSEASVALSDESSNPESKLPVALAEAANAAVLLENEDTLSGIYVGVLFCRLVAPCGRV